MAEPLPRADVVWQLRHKLKRVFRRRFNYVRNQIRRGRKEVTLSGPNADVGSQVLLAGQLVRVRSREEIEATLNPWNYLKGCGFMEEMWQYCGTQQRVLKPVQRFLDERDYRVKKARGIVILEGVHCLGTADYGRCDRNCYYFWREEWLAIDGLPRPDPTGTPEVLRS